MLLCDLVNVKQYSSIVEGVDDEINLGPDYVPMVKPSKIDKKKHKAPTTDNAQNSLIQTLWFYNNSDAS